ncbi:MAG: hypothetical protein P4L10_14680 [Acidobacteriaceae bacterium]|nr:hypothetical protein [Acidobacteriaceae bacterium]
MPNTKIASFSVCILWMFLLCPASSEYFLTFSKTTVISKDKNWIPIGKFTGSAHFNIRARVVASAARPEATEKAELSIMTYSPNRWIAAVKATNCTNKLENQSEQITIQVPLDGSWSLSVPMAIPDGTAYVVATDCYGIYASHFMGNPTEIEVTGASSVAFTNEELYPGTTKEEIIFTGDLKWRERVGMSYFAIASLGLLLVFVLLSQVLFKSLSNKMFIFGFPGLMIAVAARILLHLVLITDAIFHSGLLYLLATVLDLTSQIAFTFHCVLVLLNWPAGNRTHVIIHSVTMSVLYMLLLSGPGPIGTLLLRFLMVVQLVVCYIMGRQAAPSKPAFYTYLFGMVYLLSFVALGFGTITCTGSADILLSRIEVVVASFVCPVASYWIVAADFLLHSFIFGVTLFASGYLTK